MEITTDSEFEFSAELLRDHRYNAFWIGASDKDVRGTFVYQHSKLKISEKYWAGVNTVNRWGSERCVHMRRYYDDLEIMDASCLDRYYFVCERP